MIHFQYILGDEKRTISGVEEEKMVKDVCACLCVSH